MKEKTEGREIDLTKFIYGKCPGNCRHYEKRNNKDYCTCPGRVGSGDCFRCGGI